MKTAEDRDAMVTRVKKFTDQYPNLADAPEGTGPIVVQVKAPFDQHAYVTALYEVAAKGEPVARDKTGTAVFGVEAKQASPK